MGRLVIVNYGMGNIGSVENAFRRLGEDCLVADDPRALANADGIVLPGVGAFQAAMGNIRARGLDDSLSEQVVGRGKPFLGICLGMQLIATDSVEQGYATGLGWIDGHVLKLEPEGPYPIPHVGWNDVRHWRCAPLLTKIEDGTHFFFDHSYHLQCRSELVIATCDYGGRWVAAVQRDNIFGVQFHPEKSQRSGLRLLRNFLNLVGARSRRC